MRTEDLTKLRLPSGKRSMYFFIGFSLPKAMRFRFSVTNHFRKNRLSSNLFNHDINCKKSYKNKQSTEGNFSRCFALLKLYLLNQILDNFAGYDKTCNRRNKCGTAGNLSALGAFSLSFGRAYAICFTAYCHIVNRFDRLFL